ncbi:hypothetical protein [Arthrobacter sp. Marseille-P9274]|uniref:hypothetical protein n=1 Tax=Arthrobacter sp. Marseille-P9274 TaxID=2866572 RepID=UPI0021C71ECE|nr:hypothetical protein [Arthrobacter sp. Marseille-P9274]
MSKESQQPRSRRELRLQRSEAADHPQDRDVAGSEAGASEIPAGAPDAPSRDPKAGQQRPAERSSQARARDREAHQAYKALTEALPKVPAPREQQNPPTRRQLRLQQLERERGAQAAGQLRAKPAEGVAVSGTNDGATAGNKDDGTSGKADGGMTVDAGYQPQHPPVEGGRRDRRKREQPAQPDNAAATAAVPELPPAAAKAVEAGEMSVEQALAARELLIGQAKNMANVLAAQEQDPRKVDLEVLAQQKALAERAAVLNRRAADKQRLSAEARQQRTTATGQPPVQDLASAPMEFVRMPGSEKHVLRPSATSHVPIVADRPQKARPAGRPEKVTGPATPLPDARTKAAAGAAPAPARPADAAKAATPVPPRKDTMSAAARNRPAAKPAPRKPAAQEPAGPAPRSRLLAHAENVADNKIQPLRATNAHGLDPLDARTAGLGQANRMRIAVIAALALGALAFIAGITMMIISFSG